MTVIELRLGPRPDEPGPPITRGPQSYSAEVTERLADDAALMISKYPEARSALLPLLHLVQAEDGYLTPAGIAFCATQLSLSAAEVTAVATFYSMYRRTPTGEYLVGVCTNTLCAVMGGDAILEVLEDHLGVHAGETTADGKITLEHVECNAACDYAPVMMVNWEFFDNQTPSSARELVDDLQEGASVTPTRGAPLCTFRQTARILAGFPDERPGVNDGTPGAATLAGLRIAHERGMQAPQPGAATSNVGGPDDQRLVKESARDQAAPAPSADVPPRNGEAK
ncbi:MAG: NADH-quinone oxidoreductase subunit [Mycobacterium sp.]|nr:NADH-quinone oxidoreductase subunit [Mycobacterium sp.]